MIKLIFSIFLFLFIPSFAFAGTDTDAICIDDNNFGEVYKSIQVFYPTHEVNVQKVWKDSTSDGDTVLYYVVNVLSNSKKDPYMGKYTERAELYSYKCNTKKAKFLALYPIDASAEWYGIDQVIQNNIVLRRFESAADDGGAIEFSVYSTKTQKTLFTIKNTNNNIYHTTVTGFVDGKSAWYLYFSQPGYIVDYIQNSFTESALFRIDKRTKKVTKL